MNAFVERIRGSCRKLTGEPSVARVVTVSCISLMILAIFLIVVVWAVECARAHAFLDFPKHIEHFAMALVAFVTAHWFAGGKPLHKQRKHKLRKKHG